MQEKPGKRDDEELNLVFAWKASNRNISATVLSLLLCVLLLAGLVFVTEISVGAKKENLVTNNAIFILPSHKGLPDSIQGVLNKESVISEAQESPFTQDARYAAKRKLKNLTKIDKNYRSSLISLPQYEREMNIGLIDVNTDRSIIKMPTPMSSYDVSSFEELELSVRFFTEDETLNNRISFERLTLDRSFFTQEGVYYFTLGFNSRGSVIHCLPMQRSSKKFDAIVRKYLKDLRAKRVHSESSEQWGIVTAIVEWGEAND